VLSEIWRDLSVVRIMFVRIIILEHDTCGEAATQSAGKNPFTGAGLASGWGGVLESMEAFMGC